MRYVITIQQRKFWTIVDTVEVDGPLTIAIQQPGIININGKDIIYDPEIPKGSLLNDELRLSFKRVR
jgi:hypothetical protein